MLLALLLAINITPTPEPATTPHEQNRELLVGPGVREPQPYPGYTGFNGWASVTRTKKGTLLVTFSSGYWHASPPTPITGLKKEDIDNWVRMGLVIPNAPRGGRAEVMRSTDNGKSWSNPAPMIDTQWDDRAPAAAQLPDGTLVASFFTYPEPFVGIIRSFDDGKTWEQTPHRVREPFDSLATDGPPLVMPDGSLLLAAYGSEHKGDKYETIGIWSSRDKGVTWTYLASIRAQQEMTEPSIARLKDGRLVLITRSEGALSWSSDNGRTWTEPRNLSARIFDPWLMTMPNGTLLTLHGSYTKDHRGLRALLSKDNGETWFGAGANYGFTVDPTAYGYSRGALLPDGSIYVVYQGTGGHKTQDASSMKIYGLRIRPADDARGIHFVSSRSTK